MADVLRYIQKKKRSEEGNKVDFEKKVLREGTNKFRMVGEIRFVFEHWFKSKDGISIHSICGKHYDENGSITGSCKICKEYENAVKLLADEDGSYTAEQIEAAEVIVGDKIAEGDKYASAWKAKEHAYINVIDRDDTWCAENKHTKILSKSKSQAGISSARGGIFDNIVELFEEYGDYEKYDIKMKKSGKGMDTKYPCFKDKEVELTPEEKKYQTYDLESISRPTSEELLTRWLEVGAKKKDDNERSEKPKSKSLFASKVKKPVDEDEVEEVEEVEQEEEQEEKPKAKVKVQAKAAPPVDDEEDDEEQEVEEEQEEEDEEEKPAPKQQLKVKVKEEPKKKKEEDVELAECPECNANIPITSTKCPDCGVVFDGFEEEDSDV